MMVTFSIYLAGPPGSKKVVGVAWENNKAGETRRDELIAKLESQSDLTLAKQYRHSSLCAETRARESVKRWFRGAKQHGAILMLGQMKGQHEKLGATS